MFPGLSKYHGTNPAGYYISEKLNGVRALWNGVDFISKNGNSFTVPAEIKATMPPTYLDGELYAGGDLSRVAGLCRRKVSALNDWQGVTFEVFDIPDTSKTFQCRRELLANLQGLPEFCRIVPQTICQGYPELLAFYDAVKASGGEGIVLKSPSNMYRSGRDDSAMKIKYEDDFEVDGWTVSAASGQRIIFRDYE